MILYKLDHIAQRVQERMILDIDRLEIEAGRIHALLGPNGAGKTTLLRLLAFLDAPVQGTLQFCGQLLPRSGPALLALRRRVVLVDQHPIMFSTSVRKNIEFGLKIRGIGRAQRQRVVDEVLDTVGLRRYREARAHELSGGETQRLALARALALRPEVLLCDEPTASVDADNQAIIVSLLQQINYHQGTSIIFTTHDRLQAAALAQHSISLENGRLAAATQDNRYAAVLQRQADGRVGCLLQGRVLLHLSEPPVGLLLGQALQVRIDPRTILLHNTPATGWQTEAMPTGTVTLLMAEGESVRILVHIGVPVTVLLDQATYRCKRPQVGDLVHLQFEELRFSAENQP